MAVRTADIHHELQALRSLVERLVAEGSHHAGETIRRLEGELAGARAGRNDLAAALGAVSAERDEAQAKVRVLSDRLLTLTAQLERLREERSAAPGGAVRDGDRRDGRR